VRKKKPEGKRGYGRPRHGWGGDIIKINLQEIKWGPADYIFGF
jgi:hypothetical protein